MRVGAVVASFIFAFLTVGSGGRTQGTAADVRKAWGSPESQELKNKATQLREAGDFSGAAALYGRGYRQALAHGETQAAVRHLMGAGGCRLANFEYKNAQEAFLEARELARRNGYQVELGAIAFNLSSLYLQTWDVKSALAAADEGLGAIRDLGEVYYRANLLLHQAMLRARLDQMELAEPLFYQGIEAARARHGPGVEERGDTALEATGWDLLGTELLRRGRVAEAERALGEAFRLRLMFRRQDLETSYGRLGALKLEQGELAAAARFTEYSITDSTRSARALPTYLLYHQRGRILKAQGNLRGALEAFRQSVELGDRWRLEVMPADSFRTSSNVALHQLIYTSFVETAAELALRGSRELAAEALWALDRSRAASLLEAVQLREACRRRLRPEYWEILGKLRLVETRLAGAKGVSDDPEAARLRLRLAELEAEAGLTVLPSESFRTQESLIHCRESLKERELLLDFHLADTTSYLWVVTRDRLELHRLAPRKVITEAVIGFRSAVEEGGPGAERLGAKLYGLLFGQLRGPAARKSAWMLALDDALFELPFTALVTGWSDGKAVYLVESRSVEVVPGARWLAHASKGPGAGPWIGVGDPIYNVADTRWRGAQGRKSLDSAMQLGRLVASRREVENCARSWGGSTILLTGPDASRQRLLRALEAKPAVVHLATHVLLPSARRDQALIAFSLGPSAQPEFLTTAEVAALEAPGALVAMSGCQTASGDLRAGAGLIGLTRAWLMAGASGVVASQWPVPDSTGDLFSSFYSHLRGAPAAEALRRATLEMLQSDSWRREPKYWAAYTLTGGFR